MAGQKAASTVAKKGFLLVDLMAEMSAALKAENLAAPWAHQRAETRAVY